MIDKIGKISNKFGVFTHNGTRDWDIEVVFNPHKLTIKNKPLCKLIGRAARSKTGRSSMCDGAIEIIAREVKK
jgi:hypothetical protein